MWLLDIQLNITLEWMPKDIIDDKSTFVQVMAWCWQATSEPLPEPLLTQIYVIIYCQWPTMSSAWLLWDEESTDGLALKNDMISAGTVIIRK